MQASLIEKSNDHRYVVIGMSFWITLYYLFTIELFKHLFFTIFTPRDLLYGLFALVSFYIYKNISKESEHELASEFFSSIFTVAIAYSLLYTPLYTPNLLLPLFLLIVMLLFFKVTDVGFRFETFSIGMVVVVIVETFS